MTSSEQAPPLQTKRCNTCASEIPIAASKCVKCGTYQNYRRYFEFGNSTIALLIALISVISLASKNLADVYRSVFIDPLQPNFTAHISSIERDKLSILFQNNGTNRITVEGGAICRVPIFKSEPDLKDGWDFRYAKPSEVSAVHLVVYQNPDGLKVIEAGSATTSVYALHQTRPEEGRPFEETVPEVRAYCFVSYVDQRGNTDGEFVTIKSIDAYFLQKQLMLQQGENAPHRQP
jgi:ribulose-5-phosphate 4-epimerase/fuculose-1-phosphate aldolase/ribosomal protein L40E